MDPKLNVIEKIQRLFSETFYGRYVILILNNIYRSFYGCLGSNGVDFSMWWFINLIIRLRCLVIRWSFWLFEVINFFVKWFTVVFHFQKEKGRNFFWERFLVIVLWRLMDGIYLFYFFFYYSFTCTITSSKENRHATIMT